MSQGGGGESRGVGRVVVVLVSERRRGAAVLFSFLFFYLISVCLYIGPSVKLSVS